MRDRDFEWLVFSLKSLVLRGRFELSLDSTYLTTTFTLLFLLPFLYFLHPKLCLHKWQMKNELQVNWVILLYNYNPTSLRGILSFYVCFIYEKSLTLSCPRKRREKMKESIVLHSLQSQMGKLHLKLRGNTSPSILLVLARVLVLVLESSCSLFSVHSKYWKA